MRTKFVAPILLIAHALGLILFVFFRLVDGDEGFYLAAARAFSEGKLLYTDFFYPQMPFLPMVLGPFSDFGFTSLHITRLISVTVSIVGFYLFYSVLKKMEMREETRIIILFLYSFSGLNLIWHSVAKTYAWTDCFLAAMILISFKYMLRPKVIFAVSLGFLLSIAVSFRLVFIPLIFVFLIFLVSNGQKRLLLNVTAFLLTFVIFMIPSIYILAQDPNRFIFDNIGFHLIRNPGVGAIESIIQKARELGKLFINPQSLVLLLGLMISGNVWVKSKKNGLYDIMKLRTKSAFIAAVGFVILFVYVLPNPIHHQYFVQVLPFVLLLLPKGIEGFFDNFSASFLGAQKKTILPIVLGIYMLGLLPYLIFFFTGGRDHDGSNHIGNIKEICQFIEESPIEGSVYAEWAGFPVLTGRRGLPGTEFVGFDYPLPISDDEKRFYKLPVAGDLANQIEEMRPAFCVIFDLAHEEIRPILNESYLLQAKYRRYNIWVRK